MINIIANHPKKAFAVGLTLGGLLFGLAACSNNVITTQAPTRTWPAFTLTDTTAPTLTLTSEPAFTKTPPVIPASSTREANCTLEDFVKDMETIIENLESPLFETEKGNFPDLNDILRLESNESLINIHPAVLDYFDTCVSAVKITLYLQEIDPKTLEPTGALYLLLEEGGKLKIDTRSNSIENQGGSSDSIFSKAGLGIFYVLGAAEQQQEFVFEELLEVVIQIKGSQVKILFNKPEGSPSRTPTPEKISNPTNTLQPQPTNTLQQIPTNTQGPQRTNTPIPTNTYTPRPTNTLQQIPTNTQGPQRTNTPIPTNTYTPKPTNTSTPLPTVTQPPPSTPTQWIPPTEDPEG